MSSTMAGVGDRPDDGLHGVERRRMQLWAVAIVVMAGLAGSTALLALALDAGGPAPTLPPAIRVGLVPLVAVVALYLVEKERHLRRLTRAALQSVTGAVSAVGGSAPADREALTGLLTAEALGAHLAAALGRSRATGEPLAVVVVDVDRFAALNARHGHDVADRVLVEVARRLRDVARGDDVLGRIGGDELALVAEGVPATDAGASLARRLVDAVRTPLRIGDLEVQVGVSVGVVVQRGGQHDGAADVLRDARLARHLARRRPAQPWEVFDRLGGDGATG